MSTFPADALCAQGEPNDALWFPDGRGAGALQEARRICRVCPVKAECLEQALSMGFAAQGIWAGTTEHQRGRIRSKRARLRNIAALYGRELEA